MYPTKGQRVVCIDDSSCPATGIADTASKGHVYTIASVYDWGCAFRGITLVEIPPPRGYSGWWTSRFRPAVDRRSDISVFHQILDKQNANGKRSKEEA